MHPSEIKAHIEKAGSSMSLIARALGVAPQSVRTVVYGHGRSQRIEEALSKVTGVPLSTLWPKWHGAERAPRRRVNLGELHTRVAEEVQRIRSTKLPQAEAA